MHCHDATRAMSAAQEQPLGLGERVSLQLHLAMCSRCRDFERQVEFLRVSMRTYAGKPDDPAGASDARDDHNASSE